MPKVKTRKSLANRFRVTKNGKVLRRQAFRRHLKAGKSAKRLRNLRTMKTVTGYYAKKVRKALAAGGRQ